MNEPGWDKIIRVVCTYCRDVLKIESPRPVFEYIVDARSDVKAALKYFRCPNCGKRKMEEIKRGIQK